MESFNISTAKKVTFIGNKKGINMADAYRHNYGRKAIGFKYSLKSVRVLRYVSVIMLTGTDVNPFFIIAVEYGVSMVKKLKLLILTEIKLIDTLKSAINLPAKY